ncbi:MAG: zinc ribbon domain-containing protein [Bifidobacterium longum]
MLQHDADDLPVGDDIFLVVDRAVFLMAQVCFGPFAASLCTAKRAGGWPIGTRENGESMKCQVCGTEMPEGSRFCTECGAPMAQSAPSPSPQSMDGPTLVPAAPQQVPAGSMPLPITMFGRPRWSGPGRRFRYDFPALSSMIRGGVLSPGTGTPDDR